MRSSERNHAKKFGRVAEVYSKSPYTNVSLNRVWWRAKNSARYKTPFKQVVFGRIRLTLAPIHKFRICQRIWSNAYPTGRSFSREQLLKRKDPRR